MVRLLVGSCCLLLTLTSLGQAATDVSLSALEDTIHELQTAKAEALNQGDSINASRLALELNENLEKRSLQQEGASSQAFASLQRKYRILSDALERQISAENATDSEVLPIVYHPKEIKAVKEVTADFGDLYIGPTPNPEEKRLSPMPWSGYWYPISGQQLFDAPTSPLAKLDAVAAKLGRPGGIAKWEKERYQRIPAAGWEGLCSAWAMASTLRPEPKSPVDFMGVRFEVSDLKAILTKVHEYYPLKIYGIRYLGDASSDGTFQDIRPEAFHLLVSKMLFEKNTPIIIDDDPGVEVWSKPMFRMRWNISPDPQNPNAFLVEAFPWFVKHRTEVNEKQTSDDDVVSLAYEYRLYVDKKDVRDGKYKVIAGEWLGPSLEVHPDFIISPKANGNLGTANEALMGQLDLIDKILKPQNPGT